MTMYQNQKNLPYWAIVRDHSLQRFIMRVVAMYDFHLIIFHQVISINDGLSKLGYIKC